MKTFRLMILLTVLLFLTNTTAQNQAGLELMAENFTSPVTLSEAPDNSGRIFIVDQIGEIKILMPDGTLLSEPFLDIKDNIVSLMSGFDERGLLGLAFHPEYSQNRKFYIYYSAPLRDSAPEDFNNTSIIAEYMVSANPNIADINSERILLEVDQPQFNHAGGTVTFGPDGYLYISLGDGGGSGDTGRGHVDDWYLFNEGGNGQDIEDNLLGSILRIDVDNGNPYAIPSDNPFVGTTGLDEIYAYGFRNPYRISFDMEGNNWLFAGDAGQELYEEISIVEKGGNYGWSVKEGTHCFDADNPTTPPDNCPDVAPNGDTLKPPVIEFLNSKNEGGVGVTVVGGYVYRGSIIPDLTGKYVFGVWSDDFQTANGLILVSEPAPEGLWDFDTLQILNNGAVTELNQYILAFGQDSEGELYILTTENTGPEGNTGKVYKLIESTATDAAEDMNIPAEYKLYKNYPNPFNPSTRIKFSIPESNLVQIKVYDMLGRETAIVINREFQAGIHEVDFTAEGLSSGLYIYKLQAGSFSESHKMMLLK
jgi:glucose/arabinose dehydrogenase